MSLIAKLARQKWISQKRRLEWYPPFWVMRIKVLELSADWRSVRIRLPLNTFSTNPGGVMFGGYQASLADPIAAIACARVFPGYSVWTRGLTLDFIRGGSTDLELRFDFPADQERAIRSELEERGRATPVFEYAYYRTDGELCTRILNTVAIRPKGYTKATTPPADPKDL